ncbi:hypothetical protein [Photobacterium leiognathi]|uniref:hypothetical protein n=1 Tax=Photobacterium leiognathi TaxID=553611 RepID=UPI000769D522|nr:hypothetical protein [Photobacterium leiognathi]
MKHLLTKTLGGLDRTYYFRNFLFGLPFCVFLIYLTLSYNGEVKDFYFKLFFPVISTLLYPYAKFVYDSIIEFIMGDNIIVSGLGLAVIVKLFVISLVWIFSIFIAPIGLIYLYFYHSKQEKIVNNE